MVNRTSSTKASLGKRHGKARFRVGQSVSFPFGTTRVTGRIVEDRGGLGVGGRRLYGIVFAMPYVEDMYVELPEAELTLEEETPEEQPA